MSVPASQMTGLLNPNGGINFGNLIGNGLNTANNVLGANNMAGALNSGYNNAIGTQQSTLGNIGSIYAGQQGAGNAAFSNLTNLMNGSANGDYSNFYNSPGYQFAVQQGTQAINRQASANGSLFAPQTLASIGQYVTGTASQNYNNYVSNLMGAAGFGASANQGLSSANLATGNNISQLQAATGAANASGAAGSTAAYGNLLQSLGGASGVGGFLNSLFGASGSTNASGMGGGGIGGVVGGIGQGISNLFGGGSNNFNPGTFNTQMGDFTNNLGFSPDTSLPDFSLGTDASSGLDYVTPNSGDVSLPDFNF